ncbi:GRAM domain-containing protein 2B isoform X2 [Amia ocellicauda]
MQIMRPRVDRKFSLDSLNYQMESGSISGKLKKGKYNKKTEPRKAQSLEEAQLEIQSFNKAQVLAKQGNIRSQTFDLAYEKTFERSEDTGSIRSNFIKHNKTFHKLFREVPDKEPLTDAFTCAMQREVLYHGKLYISENYICFYSSVLLKDTKVVIPVTTVAIIKKQNTALLVPNALSIHTSDGEKYIFVSMRNREACFKMLKSLCAQLEDASVNSSPVFSSAKNSFDNGRNLNSSQSSLDDFDQPDEKDSPQDISVIAKSAPGDSRIWSIPQKITSFFLLREFSTVNILLFIYLMLVVLLLLSSGYIGLRIVALEEQITSMGASMEFSLQNE